MNRFGYYFFYGTLSFMCLVALLGSLAYLSFGLTFGLRALVFLISAIGSFLLVRYFPLSTAKELSRANDQGPAWTPKEKTLAIAYALALVAGIYYLLQGRSDRPLISPWDTVSSLEFFAYGAACFCLLLLSASRPQLPPFFLIIHYAWSLGIFLFVYAIGYGFDPFIHEASVKAIETQGQIQPLTPYYLGQYSLVATFHSIFGGTIAWWSKILVPLLAAIFLPLTIKKTGQGLLLLAFAFSIFTLTTPQNLAYLFLALAIFISFSYPGKKSLPLIWLLAGAALLTQPIAGLPALIFAATLTINDKAGPQFQKFFFSLLPVAYIFAVPLAFYFFGNQGAEPGLVWPNLSSLVTGFIPANPSSEKWWLNFMYLWQANRGWAYLLLAIGGLLVAWRKKQNQPWRLYGTPALALVISAVAMLAIDFHFLINYERADYPLRLLTIAALFALPLLIIPLEGFLQRLKNLTFFHSLPLYLFLSALLAASLYLSYPRFDNYHNSHGYAVSKADILAVNWIEKNAGGEDYVVLANQQVSAGALREFSFKKYYQNDIFYYPIPTGGPLYRHFLAMVERPSRESVYGAMDLTGVKLAYFVLDDYWWAADKIAAEAELIADDSVIISNGQVKVYKFIKK